MGSAAEALVEGVEEVAALAAAGAATLAVAARQVAGSEQANMFNKLQIFLRHIWLDASDAQRAIAPDLLERLTQRVAASEARHTGEVRIYVEAALPLSYLRRMNPQNPLNKNPLYKDPLSQIIRERALMLFSKLRVWDTEHNNGVLIYLQLAERAIEIVADRGIAQHVSPEQWQTIAQQMSQAFKAKQFEEGLTQALSEVSAVLVTHFPETSGELTRVNQLPNEPGVG